MSKSHSICIQHAFVADLWWVSTDNNSYSFINQKQVTGAGAQAIIKMLGHQDRWLAGGYDMDIGPFLEVASMVAKW